MVRSLVTAAFLLTTLFGFSQRQIGHFSVYQIEDSTVKTIDMVLYYPREPIQVEGATWLVKSYELKKGALMELTKENRQKVYQILEAYQEMVEVVETPEKLPASISVGQIHGRVGFEYEGSYHVDPYQTLLFFIKFDKDGRKTLAIQTGTLESKKDPKITYKVKLIWMDDKMVAGFKKVISDENINRWMRNKDNTLSPEALDILQNQ